MLTTIRKQLAAAIRDTAFEGKVWLAGGCVRDEILGRKTRDIDLTVELPDGGIKLAKHLHKLKLVSQPVVYKQFGTALVSYNGWKIELVMTRKESYRYRSRKPDVQFGTLQEDVMRRDFTINSLLMNVTDGKLADLSGRGLADLENKLVRATSHPEIIFKEDPLRMLRAIRFATELNFEIEAKTRQYIKKHSCEIRHISRERIAAETLKIIAAPDFLNGLVLMVDSGLKSAAFPGLRYPQSLLYPEFITTQAPDAEFIKPPIRLLSVAARLVLILWRHKDRTRYLKMLKLPAAEIRHVNRLSELCKSIRSYERQSRLEKQSDFRFIAWKVQDFIDEFVLLYPFTAMFDGIGEGTWYGDLEICQQIRKAHKQIRENRFSLTGDDLIRTFCIRSGPLIGKMLDDAFEYWLRNPHADNREMLDFLKKQLYLYDI